MKEYFFALLWIVASTGTVQTANAQCPKIFDLGVNGDTEATVCAPGQVSLEVSGIQLPSEGTIKWLYDKNPEFDPRTEGTLLFETDLPKHFQQACPTVCPDLLMIMINSCNGNGSEPDNEFFIFHSGSGFFADDLQFSFNSLTNTGDSGNPPNQNNHINVGSNPCMIQRPAEAFMNRLKQGVCNNESLYAAGPGDFIPPDALVIFYTSSEVTFDYDNTSLCNSGRDVYVMQSSCKRTMGAFTNVLSNANSPNKTRDNMLALKGCNKCKDSLNYTLVGIQNEEGEYVVDLDFEYASVANGAIQVNTSDNPCQTPDLNHYNKPVSTFSTNFDITDESLCGKTVYFKAYVTPSDETVCDEVIAAGATLHIQCGNENIEVTAPESACSGTPIEIEFKSEGNYAWEVTAPEGITGLSNGSGYVKNIVQTPENSSGEMQIAQYRIKSTQTDCALGDKKVEVKIYPKLAAEIEVKPISCDGTEKGEILIQNVSGQWPIKVKIDGEISDEHIYDLSEGEYLIEIEDANHCDFSQQVEIDKLPNVEVSMPEMATVTEGSTVQLQAEDILGIAFDQGETVYQWSPAEGLSCTDCPVTVASPSVNTEYTLTVTNIYGCFGAAGVFVEVVAKLNVSVPNAFTPNKDGLNDVLYILSNSDEVEVVTFEVFNRWGVSMFKTEDSRVNDKNFGWNGTFKEEEAPADYYTYYYSVRLPDGSLKNDKGGVLLIR